MKKINLEFNQDFHMAFQIDRTKIFEVNYYKLGENKYKHFSTTASMFNRPKTDYIRGGQAQEALCSNQSKDFYTKWDLLHLKDLNLKQYNDLVNDLNHLAEHYNCIISNCEIEFTEIRWLSMRPINKSKIITTITY